MTLKYVEIAESILYVGPTFSLHYHVIRYECFNRVNISIFEIPIECMHQKYLSLFFLNHNLYYQLICKLYLFIGYIELLTKCFNHIFITVYSFYPQM